MTTTQISLSAMLDKLRWHDLACRHEGTYQVLRGALFRDCTGAYTLTAEGVREAAGLLAKELGTAPAPASASSTGEDAGDWYEATPGHYVKGAPPPASTTMDAITIANALRSRKGLPLIGADE